MERRNKISIIGAGQIGSTVAHLVILKNLGDIFLIDKDRDLAVAKAMDLEDAAVLEGQDNEIFGTDDYREIIDSDVVVITAGIPRQPWMKDRAELTEINSKTIEQVSEEVKKYAPKAFVVVITNPLDDMTQLVQKITGFESNKVVGMAGVLDSARFARYLARELGVSRKDITATVVGPHNDNMKPLVKYSSVKGIPLEELIKQNQISRETIEDVIEKTKMAGKEISNLMGERGSAYYGPATAAVVMLDSYLNNRKRILVCSTLIKEKGIYAGMPVILGRRGVEKIIDLNV